MLKPTVFIGSSSEGLEVAKSIADELESIADTTVWDEDVFEFGRGFLEELLYILEKHDFAILILTPDDVTDSRGTQNQSPRDNVLFESGLFMGRLGRQRTFIVRDKSSDLKIPSDLAGVTLLNYDHGRMSDNSSAAVRAACMRISKSIKKPEFRRLSGEWISRYILPYKDKDRMTDEVVEIKPSCGKICIESKQNKKNDNYVGYGDLVMDKHFIGEWRSTRSTASAGGAFLLTLHPLGNIMYGVFVSPEDDYKIIQGGWVLAKKGHSDAELNDLMNKGIELLKGMYESNLQFDALPDDKQARAGDSQEGQEHGPRAEALQAEGQYEH